MKIMRVLKEEDRKRTETVGIRVTPMELDTLIRTAEEAHEYPSSYLRRIFLQHIDEKQAYQTGRILERQQEQREQHKEVNALS
jgi:hypothetical protein